MNYKNEYYKNIYIDDYLYKVISQWLSMRLKKEDQEMFAGDHYTEADYRADMKNLKKTKNKEKLLHLITDSYIRICIFKMLNYLKSSSLDDVPALVLYGQVSYKGFLFEHTEGSGDYKSLYESPIYRHIDEDLFNTTKENRDIYVRKLIGMLIKLNQLYQKKVNRIRKNFYIKNGLQLSGNKLDHSPLFNPKTAIVNHHLINEKKTTRKSLFQLMLDVRYFKVKIYTIVSIYNINLIDEAQKDNQKLFDGYELHLLRKIRETNTHSENEIIEEVEKSIEIEKLKPRITEYNKPQLSKDQVVALFNVLKQCNVFNKDIMRQTMDMGISLLTGYSEKQIHKGTNTPVNEILNTKESITHIQNLLKKAIDILDREKIEINR